MIFKLFSLRLILRLLIQTLRKLKIIEGYFWRALDGLQQEFCQCLLEGLLPLEQVSDVSYWSHSYEDGSSFDSMAFLGHTANSSIIFNWLFLCSSLSGTFELCLVSSQTSLIPVFTTFLLIISLSVMTSRKVHPQELDVYKYILILIYI